MLKSTAARAAFEDAPALRVKDLSVRFGGIVAVDRVSFELERGCCGIIGPNGAGKSTLLDALSGIQGIASGEVTLAGADATGRSSTWLARHGVRRTFQRHQAFGALSVEDNLRVPLEWRHRTRRFVADLVGIHASSGERNERIDAVLDRCDLTEVRHQRAGTLPIGQIRLLEFARAVVDQPTLLLLDEPTSGLGPQETERLARAILAQSADTDCAVVVVEHDIGLLQRVCDRLIALDRGAMLADGVPSEVVAHPQVITAYTGAA